MTRRTFALATALLLLVSAACWGLGTTGAKGYSTGITTGTYLTYTARSLTSGRIIRLVADDDSLNGGHYLQCLGGTSYNTLVFGIGEGGTTTITPTTAQAAGTGLTVTGTSITTGTLLKAVGTGQTTGSCIEASMVDGTNTTGLYIKCADETPTVDFSVGEGGNTYINGTVSVGSTASVAGACTFPVSASVTNTTATIANTTSATYYGKIVFLSSASATTMTLPTQPVAAGTWIHIIRTGAEAMTINTADEQCITVNDATADGVAFSNSYDIGAAVFCVSNGTSWVIMNQSSQTMTVISS